jgi:anti-sigma regulatory factor (Ser/Thr protein kinase)
MMVRRSFEASEESVGAARRFVIGTIADVTVELQDSIAVMVSELSTNALVHATGGFEVTVDRSDGGVVVSVGDWGDGTPVLQSPDSSEPHGRGLRIVNALSDEWGVSSVWFRLSFDPRSSGASTDGTILMPVTRQVPKAQPSRGHRATSSASADGADSGRPASRHRGPRRRTRVKSRTDAWMRPSTWSGHSPPR